MPIYLPESLLKKCCMHLLSNLRLPCSIPTMYISHIISINYFLEANHCYFFYVKYCGGRLHEFFGSGRGCLKGGGRCIHFNHGLGKIHPLLSYITFFHIKYHNFFIIYYLFNVKALFL